MKLEDSERRTQILDAARDSFRQFGFAKSSMDEIARRANVSRPLVYKKYGSKERILAALLTRSYEGLEERLEKLRGTRRERLQRICEICWVDPRDQLNLNSPLAAEIYEACARIDPEGEKARGKLRLKAIQSILGSREQAELFEMAMDGVGADLPVTPIYLRRIQLLVERFI
jgi:AcrR family transcriptional regulator